jgi:hypothetical protein
MRDAGVDQEVRMREVRHSDSSVNDRYTHVLEEARLAAAEQVAAVARKAANGRERHGFSPFSPLGGWRSPCQPSKYELLSR